jgi:hypothetical protein
MLRFDLVVVAEENTAQRRREQARLLISFQVDRDTHLFPGRAGQATHLFPGR